MSGLVIRDALPGDVPALCDLLNAIVRAGGTTARLQEMTVSEFTQHYVTGGPVSACLVALLDNQAVGFQALNTDARLPAGWVDIGTFTRRENSVKGAGAALFAATRSRAAGMGFAVINATIRADNVPGLAYYARMGFLDYKIDRAVPLGNGQLVDRINRRFDLI